MLSAIGTQTLSTKEIMCVIGLKDKSNNIERPEYTLDEIFQYLSHADKPCIVAIDEFQQIAKYPEKNRCV